MEKTIRFTIALLFITHSVLYSQSKNKMDCSFLKNCKMINLSTLNGGYVIFNDSIHTEYVEEGKYFIKSKLEWINDCEYNATITEINWPNFKFPVGEVMNSKLAKMENDTLYFDVKVRNIKIKSKFVLSD